MNPAARGIEDNASGPVWYMALELSNKRWSLTFGGGGKAQERFGTVICGKRPTQGVRANPPAMSQRATPASPVARPS